MALTDIQISEELQTGAPSIKYRGNEGPQAPMQMASDPMLKEEYEKYVYEMQEQGREPISFEQWLTVEECPQLLVVSWIVQQEEELMVGEVN